MESRGTTQLPDSNAGIFLANVDKARQPGPHRHPGQKKTMHLAPIDLMQQSIPFLRMILLAK
jgi:hypothetical protein